MQASGGVVVRAVLGFFLLGAGLLLPGPAIGAEGPADAPLVAEPVRQAMQDRNYAEAVKAIDAALQAKDSPRDYLLYLKGWALSLAKQYDASIAVYDQLNKEQPGSRWARRARFAKGAALARKGDFQGAESIYRAEAEFLLSDGRRQELAEVYLEFADAHFKPPKDDQKLDFQKALAFYTQALQFSVKPERRAEVELRIARCHEELGRHAQAAGLYVKFSQEHPQSPLDIEARFCLGRCRLAEGNLREARRVWQDLLAKYPDAKSDRVPEAAFSLSRTWRVPQPQTDEELSRGVAALESFLERFPRDKLAGQAELEIAKSYLHRGRQEDAVGRLSRFVKDDRYKGRPELPEAWNLLGRAYQAQKKFPEALAAWREYLARFPAHEAWSAVQKEIVNTEYLMGLERYKAKDYEGAAKLLSEFLSKYPLDPRGPGILFLLGQMEHQQKKFEAAIVQWKRLVSKHPGTNEASHAQFMIGQTLEQDLGRLEEALEVYRKLTWGDRADEARQAAARLTEKRMAIATPRAFRSDETPKVALTSRNLESVGVRAYKVDLETYFRKMHFAAAVEQLDIALIDPDRTFDFPVPKYAKYQELESRIDVPLPEQAKAGVMAVTVSSKTLEATTLVIQSDLEIVTKSSRDEVFVFAENLRTGKPWPKARVLVSNGRQIVAEGATDEQGVYRQSVKELQEGDDVRVFAAADGHVASNTLSLAGLKAGQALADKGYIYTDRPIYRAGQRVAVRGGIRHAAGDALVIEKDKKYRLEVLDSRNRVVHQESVTLGAFGTFHAQFSLPSLAPVGQYRVVAKDEAGHAYQGSFSVRPYQPETIRLAIDAPRTVYYRGEEIEGTIRAAWFYGAPLAGEEVRFQLVGEPVQTARTDAKGEVRFKLPTAELSESGRVYVRVSLPARNVETAMIFVLATRGFSIGVSTVRPFFVAGEPFEAEITTRDAEEKPIAQKLSLKVLELTIVDGKVGERQVEEQPIATAADGKARPALKLAKGGRYRIRAEGIDRFKTPISGETEVQICDDEDQTRLRILADKHHYCAGDTAEVVLYWREAPALALVTHQGSRVLDYRLIELQKGPNKLSVPMTGRLAPNFDLAVAVMTDNRSPRPVAGEGQGVRAETAKPRFHEATSEFFVSQSLQVALAWQPKGGRPGPARPGEPIDVTITTTDPQGKPIAAELSLAMLPDWPAFRDGSAVPWDFSLGQARETSMRTASSITFEYHPATRPIHPRLLAERDRQEIAQEEEASRRAGLTERSGGGMGGMGGMGGFGFGGMPVPVARKAKGPNAPVSDFDSLIALIQSATHPATWDDVAGAGSFGPFETDLSLKVAQKQSTHGRGSAGEKESGPAIQAPPAAGPVSEAAETLGYWNPAIVTGPDGKATLMLTVPEPSGAWRLTAKGITAGSLAGEQSAALVARKPLFGEITLPAAFTEGDQAELPVTVHNDLIAQGPIEVALRTTIAGRTTEEKKTLDVKAKGVHDLSFKVVIPSPLPQAGKGAAAQFELAVTAAGAADTLRRGVPLTPYGMEVYAAAGGAADADATAWLEPPKDMPLESPRLTILVGPTVERDLLDILFPSRDCRDLAVLPASEVETATSDLLAGLGLQKLLGVARDGGGPAAADLDARVHSAVGLLVLAQNDDGGWSWTGRGGTSDRYSSARSVWALGLARRAGYPVADEAFNKAVDYLRSQSAAIDNRDFESRAVLLHALTVAGQGDFAVANHLYRERPSLSPAALAYLALAFIELDRKSMAGEALNLLAGQGLDQPRCLPWSVSPVEVRALYALAAQSVAPKSPKTKELIDWLLSHRTGRRWTPDKATGPAALALCDWFAESRFEGQKYKLAISVNDAPVQTLEIDPAEGTRAIDAPVPAAGKGKFKVGFQITGRGRYSYQCVLGGYVPADRLKSTATDWSVARRYEPAPLELEGRDVPRGFGIVQGLAVFHNPLTQLPVARRAMVELSVERKTATVTTPQEQLEYLVLTEPVPAGVSIDERSIRGGFDRYEITPGAIVFYVGNRRKVEPIVYTIHGYVPGTYRAAPSVLRNAYRPDQMAVAGQVSNLSPVGQVSNLSQEPAGARQVKNLSYALTVLPLGAAGNDPYRLSPVELFELGKHAAAKKDWKTAAAHLAELVEKWNLQSEVYKQAVGLLLEAHLEIGPPAQVVHYFEIVKEKWPEQEILFAKIVKVAAAYHAIGEFERSYLVYRATVEGSFTRESGVAGFLEEQGEFLRSVDFMGRLLGDYPPEAYVAEAQYALAQQVHAKAPQANEDPKLREKKVNRVDLVRRTWRMLESFLTAWPEDPAADQAALAAAGALLELKDYAQAAAAGARYAARYPKSELLDAYWYVIGYSQFALGRYKESLEMCGKVAEHQRVDRKTGRAVESPNKWRAIYILGQVYHTLGQPAEAIRQYRRVEDRFSDARASIAWLMRKGIELPEVTTVKPGQPAEVELKFRNLAACDVKAYRIDLMKFSLLKGDLTGITRINLAGIRPLCDAPVKLGEGQDYRDRTRKLPLPLDKEGAYLVVCRGENLHTSGLVLVTPLAVEVQADRVSGQVRTMVKDTLADRYLSGAEVRVIGSRNQDFVSGTTDFRGVFTAERIQGFPTVIAQAGPGRYAFYRSPGFRREEAPETELAGPPPQGRPAAPQPSREEPDPFAKQDESANKAADPFADADRTAPAAAAKPAQTANAPKRRAEPAPSLAIDMGGQGVTASEKRIEEALDSPTEIDFVDMPLADVIAYLKDRHKIEIQVDRKALDDAGVGTDVAITRKLKGITLRSVLNLILRDVGLTFTPENEVLLITTPEEAGNRLVNRTYNVADLVLPPGAADSTEADFDSLIDLITSTVEPTTWDAVGGPGSIAPFDQGGAPVLVFSQTPQIHREVARLLDELRKAGGKKAVEVQSAKAEAKPAASPTPPPATAVTGAPAKASKRGRASGMGFGGGFGGMGGMGGGMGMGGFGGPTPSPAAGQQVGDDLLQGLNEANRGYQDQGAGKLKGRYKQGMGMGGMGGVGAGGAY